MYSNVNTKNYDQLVKDYSSLVKRIAFHLRSRLPDSVQLDDLLQAGMIGLFDAAKNYDGSKGAGFETFAGIRIRGAMLDEMRKGDWIPRSVHRNNRKISEAIRNVENRKCGDATDQEIAEEMNVSMDEYYSLTKDIAGSRLFSFDDLLNESGDLDDTEHHEIGPQDDIQKQALIESLSSAIETLPEREQLVLALYYDEELNLKEIGQVLGVSESRVSQIHTQAALRLRSRLGDWNSSECIANSQLQSQKNRSVESRRY